jgi:hypothetical protein
MLFKMLGIERSWETHKDGMQRPRQIFVTQSRMLASKVEEYFQKLLESLNSATGSEEDMEKIAKKVRDTARLVDEDEEENWRGDLPTRFSDLQDEHFPLFVTYDRVCFHLLQGKCETDGLNSCVNFLKVIYKRKK